MDDGLRIVTEMHQTLWEQFRGSFDDLAEDELHWRVHPPGLGSSAVLPIRVGRGGHGARSRLDRDDRPRTRQPIFRQVDERRPGR